MDCVTADCGCRWLIRSRGAIALVPNRAPDHDVSMALGLLPRHACPQEFIAPSMWDNFTAWFVTNRSQLALPLPDRHYITHRRVVARWRYTALRDRLSDLEHLLLKTLQTKCFPHRPLIYNSPAESFMARRAFWWRDVAGYEIVRVTLPFSHHVECYAMSLARLGDALKVVVERNYQLEVKLVRPLDPPAHPLVTRDHERGKTSYLDVWRPDETFPRAAMIYY